MVGISNLLVLEFFFYWFWNIVHAPPESIWRLNFVW